MDQKNNSSSQGVYQSVLLGARSDVGALPAEIRAGTRTYYLVHSPSQELQLLSSICPHQGGHVVPKADRFECQGHQWCFDLNSGRCLSAPGREGLTAFKVTDVDGMLYAELPISSVSQPLKMRMPPKDLKITLHAHACLEFAHQGFSLLTDPWLAGPAFMGSWTQYPPSDMHPSTLDPKAIFISHEHSDHFHEPTLRHFKRQTPIYVPAFPNGRLEAQLGELGFTQVTVMRFGETYTLSNNFKVTCFEPASLWNDAIVLLEIEGFRILNLNDAGLNQRIAQAVYPVDVVASAFAGGASGFPMTWTHLTDQAKDEIMTKNCQGLLAMLHQAMEMYGAATLIPFAGHFTFYSPLQHHFISQVKTNLLPDVVEAFKGSNVRVIDLLPGEAWDVSKDTLQRLGPNRQEFFDLKHRLRYAENVYVPKEFSLHHPEHANLSQDDVRSYFLKFNQCPDILFCEDLTLRVQTVTREMTAVKLDLSFILKGGVIQFAPVQENPNLRIRIPEALLAQIIRENVSWDEAHIGYWCQFSRQPDVYHAGFWRMIQAPYFLRRADIAPAVTQGITADSIIAEILERHGDPLDRILRRYGFYCLGCRHSTQETLRQGARQHGIRDSQLERMVSELNKIAMLDAYDVSKVM